MRAWSPILLFVVLAVAISYLEAAPLQVSSTSLQEVPSSELSSGNDVSGNDTPKRDGVNDGKKKKKRRKKNKANRKNSESEDETAPKRRKNRRNKQGNNDANEARKERRRRKKYGGRGGKKMRKRCTSDSDCKTGFVCVVRKRRVEAADVTPNDQGSEASNPLIVEEPAKKKSKGKCKKAARYNQEKFSPIALSH